jgi:drug/metabolite transporter (DMT)-like permease
MGLGMNRVIVQRNTAQAAIIFVVVVLLWGSTFIAVKTCLVHWSAVQVMAGRYVLGAMLLVPLAIKAYLAQGALYKKHALSIVHLAIVGSVLPVGFMTWAQQSIPSSFAGVIASLAPMMALIAGVVLFGLPWRALHWVGVVLGTCGVAVLRWGGDGLGGSGFSGAHGAASGSALAAALFATMCWGLAAQNYRRNLSQLDPLHVTALSFQVMALAMLTVLAVQADAPSMRSHSSWVPIMYLLGLALLSVVAVTGYNWLIARWGAVKASSCTYVVPLVAVGWGYADAEPVGWNVAVACSLIAAAMWAVRQPVKLKV